MKRMSFKLTRLVLLAALALGIGSCRKGLLDQTPTAEIPIVEFWKTEADATYALMGAYASVRPCFDRDYYFDGQAEYSRVRGTSATSGNLQLGDAYQGASYGPSGYGASFDKMYRYLYGAVDRINYVIDNSKKLIDAGGVSVGNVEQVIGEARLLRGLVYFRLISMWGDVPYIGHAVSPVAAEANAEVTKLSRLPIAQVKDSILADLTYAFDKLPKSNTFGRAGKPAALALRGKVQLFWASWNKFGWPELDTFTPRATAADSAYKAAADDFKSVINNYSLTLYKNGDPGEIDGLGLCDKLPNYYYLFTPKANGDAEFVLAFNHGGVGSGQGEELMRDFSGRSHEGSQCWTAPRYEVADRYQLTATGDFAPRIIQMNPTVPATGNVARTTLNSAVNPASYANRDYRMKASIQWDYETSIGLASLASTGYCPFIYQTWAGRVTIGGVSYLTYNTDGCNSGYVYRKFVRNYGGQGRSEGDYAWPVIRLADVYLMYAEATNATVGPQADAIALVNAIRRRGALPPLAGSKTADAASFFNAIEQERIIELLAEGHRSFDLRRWRAIERVWGAPGGAGVWRMDTWGANQERFYQNTSQLTYQQNYIFRIPPAERDRNPNLTQNLPWR